MKRIILLALAAVVVPGGANAQSIERALAAAPARSRDAVTVVKWNADYTWETIKEGTNRMVCYDRSGEPGRQPFDVQCTVLGNLTRVAQNRRFAAEGADRQAVGALVAAADANGTRAVAEYGSIWITMRGADQASAGSHRTIAVPGATMASSGFPDNGRSGGAWIMAAGTSEAHLMIPGT